MGCTSKFVTRPPEEATTVVKTAVSEVLSSKLVLSLMETSFTANAKKGAEKNIIIVDYGWGYDKEKVPKQKIIVKKPADVLKAIKKI